VAKRSWLTSVRASRRLGIEDGSVRQIEPGTRFVTATAEGPFPMETTYTWEDAAGGATDMALRNTADPSGFAAVAATVMARALRKANDADRRRIAVLLER
jgi:hypothetical protein